MTRYETSNVKLKDVFYVPLCMIVKFPQGSFWLFEFEKKQIVVNLVFYRLLSKKHSPANV